ncbi:hypothetical protein MDUV_54320 [Mycolicibacterium duvalii]|uniref:Single cache domain-containing protein n=1 Tax=Mycolicibacterium duvalii TaxID=39688 RepID=A0A7I7KB18_9MYCO|nr:hypothetical protein MDUV_54320 [Mycolicibacterium duvalii]
MRRRSPWPRSLAGQAIALQILVIAVIVLAGSALAVYDARRDGDAAAEAQVLGIATTLADSPSTAEAIESGRATEILQPVTELVRNQTDIAFITIMAPDRTRYTHTDPAQIGGDYLGSIEPALQGRTFTEVYTGTLGPSVRAVAPVYDSERRVIGLVAAGILQQSLAQRWRSQLPVIAAIGVGALAISMLGVGYPSSPVAPDPGSAPGGTARHVRPSRRDPAFGVGGADRARRFRGRGGQRRGAPIVVAPGR